MLVNQIRRVASVDLIYSVRTGEIEHKEGGEDHKESHEDENEKMN